MTSGAKDEDQDFQFLDTYAQEVKDSSSLLRYVNHLLLPLTILRKKSSIKFGVEYTYTMIVLFTSFSMIQILSKFNSFRVVSRLPYLSTYNK